VRFGTALEAIGGIADTRLYENQHEVTLLGLTTETTYYFIAFGVDRSGEYQVKARSGTYLPMVTR